MVQALMAEQDDFKARIHHFEEMQNDATRQANSMGNISLDDRVRPTASKPPIQPIDRQQIGSELNNQDAIMSSLERDEEAVDPSKQAGEFCCRFCILIW